MSNDKDFRVRIPSVFTNGNLSFGKYHWYITICFFFFFCSGILHRGDLPTLLPHALAYFFGHTLVQKRGGKSEVRIPDLYMMEKIQNRSPFFVVSLMIHAMHNTSWDTNKTCMFRYPVTISHIFQVFNVDFIGERQEMTDHSTFNKCGYAWDEKKKMWIP